MGFSIVGVLVILTLESTKRVLIPGLGGIVATGGPHRGAFQTSAGAEASCSRPLGHCPRLPGGD